MKFRYLLVAALFFLPAYAQNDSGKFALKIMDEAKAPIARAFVMLHGPKNIDSVKLDAKGSASVILPKGVYSIFVSAAGFKPYCKELQISDQQVFLTIKLKVSDLNIEN
jgi:hypothetical protein